MDALLDAFGWLQQWLFEAVVQPLMYRAGLGNLLEDGYRATGWLLVGLLQIALMLLVIGRLEGWRPVEPVSDRAAVRTDVVYTLVHRLGLFRVVLFFCIDPLWTALAGQLRLHGLATWSLDGLWPGVTDVALVS
ncbi:MAG: fatty acid hydroxylase, partial [Pseudomonadota bacterium]